MLIVKCIKDYGYPKNKEVIYNLKTGEYYFADYNTDRQDDNWGYLIRIYPNYINNCSITLCYNDFCEHFIVVDGDFNFREPKENAELLACNRVKNDIKQGVFNSLNKEILDKYDKYLFNYDKDCCNRFIGYNWDDYESSRIDKETKENKKYSSVFEFAYQYLTNQI